MRIFNFHIMTVAQLRVEKREAEKFGHRVAFADFKDADKIIHGNQQIFRDSVIREKLVILGDHVLVANNIFHGDGKLELR